MHSGARRAHKGAVAAAQVCDLESIRKEPNLAVQPGHARGVHHELTTRVSSNRYQHGIPPSHPTFSSAHQLPKPPSVRAARISSLSPDFKPIDNAETRHRLSASCRTWILPARCGWDSKPAAQPSGTVGAKTTDSMGQNHQFETRVSPWNRRGGHAARRRSTCISNPANEQRRRSVHGCCREHGQPHWVHQAAEEREARCCARLFQLDSGRRARESDAS